MEKLAQPTPLLIPAFLAVSVLALFGLLLFSDFELLRTEHTLPPIEIVEQQPEITIIEQDDKPPSQQQVIEKEAVVFIEQLAEKQQHSIIINEQQDQFVRHDSVISLPNLEHRITSIEELLNDPKLTADTPITLTYTTHVERPTTLAELSDKYQDHTLVITVIDQYGQKQTKPLFEFLNQENVDLTAKIHHLTEQKHSLQTNLSKLATIENIDPQQTVIATINHGIQELSVKEIIQSGELPNNALFYLHRVTNQDQQGLWGIIQSGLIDKFREGVHIEGIATNKDSVQVIIPADADEKLSSGLSSFLGKILNKKVNSSYVYNFSTHTMNHDPNQIHPGQQLIMIHFTPQELSQIYQFFSSKRNQGVETFSINN
ncbi:MAG: hypothetical protein ACKE9I_09690 [Methylophagaceae bacterium]